MSSRTHRRKLNCAVADLNTDNMDGSLFEDVVLVVEGKQVRTNSRLLAFNSNVFAELIKDARRSRHMDVGTGLESHRTQMQFITLPIGMNEGPCEVFIPNQSYTTVQKMVKYLQSMSEECEPITGESAVKLLPLADQYQMTALKKKCARALHDTMTALRQQHLIGTIPSRDVLEYLGVADKYDIQKVRKFCMEEIAENASATIRQEISEDKHILDKTKVAVMSKMCDRMNKNYEKKLKQVREDMDKRCREIEKKRDKFMELTESWKTDLSTEVQDMIKASHAAHTKLVSDLEKNKIMDKIDDTVRQTNEELRIDIESLTSKINSVIQDMETNELIDDMHATQLRDTIQSGHESNVDNIESICVNFKTNLSQTLKNCNMGELTTGLSKCYSLHEKLDTLSTEMEMKIRALSDVKVEIEEERIAHGKTQIELRKHRKGSHKINTWLKWAKPIQDDGDNCLCFRHATARHEKQY